VRMGEPLAPAWVASAHTGETLNDMVAETLAVRTRSMSWDKVERMAGNEIEIRGGRLRF
jgi:hypothetical protein